MLEMYWVSITRNMPSIKMSSRKGFHSRPSFIKDVVLFCYFSI